MPKEHWQSLQNQRQFMEQFARRRNVSKPSDWGKVTFRSIVQMGGTFIVYYYHCSVFKALVTLFPGNFEMDNILLLRNKLEKRVVSKLSPISNFLLEK